MLSPRQVHDRIVLNKIAQAEGALESLARHPRHAAQEWQAAFAISAAQEALAGRQDVPLPPLLARALAHRGKDRP